MYNGVQGGGGSGGSDDGTMIMMVVMLVMVVCCCCCSCCSMMTVQANESEGGEPSFLKFDGYWDMMESLGMPDGFLGDSGDGEGPAGTNPPSGSPPKADTPGGDNGKKDCTKYAKDKCDGKKGKEREKCLKKYKDQCKKDNDKNAWKDKDCNAYVKDNCDGKTGKSRESCISKYKSRCVEKGGKWTSSGGSSSSPQWSGLKVKLVDDPSKGSGSATYDVGVGDYPDLRQDLDRTWNDRISGFDIPKGLRVIGYTNPNFGGTPITLDGKDEKDASGYYTHWVGRVNGEQMWDKISSLKVQDMRSSQLQGAANALKVTAGYLSAKKKSKCNVGKEQGYKFTLRRMGSSGKYSCPQGWKETNCGKVSYDTGNGNRWVDGVRLGAMQCKKKA